MRKFFLDNGEEVFVNDEQICFKKIDGEYVVLSMSNGETLRGTYNKGEFRDLARVLYNNELN